MRLTKKLAGEATDELLSILAEYSSGLRTSELSGTRRFHGERTLPNRQIIRHPKERKSSGVSRRTGQENLLFVEAPTLNCALHTCHFTKRPKESSCEGKSLTTTGELKTMETKRRK